jgi:hypothetical protein
MVNPDRSGLEMMSFDVFFEKGLGGILGQVMRV